MRFNNMTFQVETIHEKNLIEERRDEVIQWFRDEFGYIPLKWSDPEWYILALNESELIGRLGIIDRIVLVEGHQIRVGGISGVITKNKWRKRGVASTLMAQALNVFGDKLNTSFGLLLCLEEVSGFYNGLGWKVNDFSTTFEQPAGKMTFPKITMTYSCKGGVWPRGPIDLNGLPW